jgi:single-strand DNA-binding protein
MGCENVARYLSKGRPVAIDGRLDWREWETQDGAKRQTIDIIADSVQFLNARDGSAEASNGASGPGDGGEFAPAPGGDEDIPF